MDAFAGLQQACVIRFIDIFEFAPRSLEMLLRLSRPKVNMKRGCVFKRAEFDMLLDSGRMVQNTGIIPFGVALFCFTSPSGVQR